MTDEETIALAVLGGLGAATLWSAVTAAPNPKQVLYVRPGEASTPTAYVEKVHSNWIDGLRTGKFYAVCVKCANGSNDWKSAPGPLFQGADAAGCKRWGWGFHYGTSVKGAIKEAAAIARAHDRWKFDAYGVNIEKHGFGCWGAPVPNENILTRFTAMLTELRRLLPGVKLMWNGLTWKRFLNSDGYFQKGLNDELMNADYVDIYSPMFYTTCTDTAGCRRRLYKNIRASSKKWPLVQEFGPLAGTGRFSKKYWKKHGEVAAVNWHEDKGPSGPGTISIARDIKPDYWLYFYGAGSKPMLTKGWQRDGHTNPALQDVSLKMHQAYSEEPIPRTF